MKKTLLIITVFIVFILLATGVFLYVWIPFDVERRESTLAEVNALKSWLDLETSEYESLEYKLIFDPIQRVTTYFDFQSEITARSQYATQKQDTIDSFDDKLQTYLEDRLSSIEQHFGKESPLRLEYESLDKEEKKYPEQFIFQHRESLFKYIYTQNKSTNKLPVRIIYQTEDYLQQTNFEQQVGQLFSLAIAGNTLSESEAKFIRDNNLGGVVLLGNNVQNPDQLTKLTKQIQTANPRTHMFIMTDQEGGLVKRVFWDKVGSQKDLAQLSKPERCKQFKQRDELLHKLGINFNLGVVADVTSDTSSFIYSRTFSSEYDKVRQIVADALGCTIKIINTLKHYPGHGATNLDTHKGLAVMDVSKAEWQKTHLLPFTSITSEHAIMLGHLILNDIHKDTPATLSAKHVKYIRVNLKHDGLLITDDLRMLDAAGLDSNLSALRALNAGMDILLYSTGTDSTQSIMEFIKQEVKSGKVSSSKIENALNRIITSKNAITMRSDNLYFNPN